MQPPQYYLDLTDMDLDRAMSQDAPDRAAEDMARAAVRAQQATAAAIAELAQAVAARA